MRHRFQEPGKRIVSKREYAKVQGKRIGLGLLGGFFCTLTGLCIAISLFLFCGFLICAILLHAPAFVYLSLVGGTLISAFLTDVAWRAGAASIKYSRAIEAVVPLTRANTGDLPASDSLVRASQEPLQAQGTVLLRAAAETTEGREEQLLRASGGQEAEEDSGERWRMRRVGRGM